MDYYIDFLVSYEELCLLCDMMTSNNLCISIIEKLINIELDTKHIIPFLERLSDNFKDGKFIHCDTYEKIREIFILSPEIREMIRMSTVGVVISEDNIQNINIGKLLPYTHLAIESYMIVTILQSLKAIDSNNRDGRFLSFYLSKIYKLDANTMEKLSIPLRKNFPFFLDFVRSIEYLIDGILYDFKKSVDENNKENNKERINHIFFRYQFSFDVNCTFKKDYEKYFRHIDKKVDPQKYLYQHILNELSNMDFDNLYSDIGHLLSYGHYIIICNYFIEFFLFCGIEEDIQNCLIYLIEDFTYKHIVDILCLTSRSVIIFLFLKRISWLKTFLNDRYNWNSVTGEDYYEWCISKGIERNNHSDFLTKLSHQEKIVVNIKNIKNAFKNIKGLKTTDEENF